MTFTDFLDVLLKIAPVISAIVSIIAAVFISRQIVNIRRNREVDTLFKIITLSDSDRMRECKEWFIFDFDNDVTFKELKNNREAFNKITHIIHLFETMGVLVNNKYISEHLVFDKFGLLIIGSWARLEPIIMSLRHGQNSYELAENFQTLVGKYEKWTENCPLKAERNKKRMNQNEAKNFLDIKKDDERNK